MHRRIFTSTKALALVASGVLVCLTLGFNAHAASGEKAATDTVTAPSALIKWDLSAQKMNTVEAAQAAQLMEQFRQQIEARFIATGRLEPSGEHQVQTTPSGLKRMKATVDMMSFAVVRTAEDGGLVQARVDDPESARELLDTPVATSEPAKEEQ
jgi:hypothetical protein